MNQYRADLTFGAIMALGFTVVAAVPMSLLGVLNIIALVRHRPLEVEWLAYLTMWIVVPGSYFAAAIAGSTVVFAVRPLRTFLLGWAVTGAAVAACVYGAVGLALAVFFNPVGAIFLEHSTKQEAWESLPGFVALVTPVGALVGIYMGWRDRRGKSIW